MHLVGQNQKQVNLLIDSPDALLVNTHFRNVFQNATEDIQTNDVLCYNCYKIHLLIIKNHEEQIIGSDEQLQEDIDLWTGIYNNTTDESIRSTLHTVIMKKFKKCKR